MKLARELKCICYLVKCSKYLYFLKKLVCIATLVLGFFVFISMMRGKDFGRLIKKIKELPG